METEAIYKDAILFLLGMLGVLLHNLVALNKINKTTNGSVKIREYLRLERFSIAISVILVFACVFCSQEIKQLEQVGNYLGLGFIAIGYMGQSLLIWWIGKASAVIGKPNDTNEK
jgi:hypothetical protein